MPLSTAIECSADFPDDQLEEGDKILRPGGATLAGAIADLLKGAGMTPSTPSLDMEHGWEFFAEQNGRRYWILVTDLDATKLIQTKDVSPFFRRIFGDAAPYEAFLNMLHKVLCADSRFRSVKWYPRELSLPKTRFSIFLSSR